MPRSVAPLTKDIVGLAGLFLTSGTTHLVKPEVFEPLVPNSLPTSSRADLCLRASPSSPAPQGCCTPAPAGMPGGPVPHCSLAILPGNVQMSANYGKRAQRKGTPAAQAAFAGTLARLPLQLPLIRTALKAAGR